MPECNEEKCPRYGIEMELDNMDTHAEWTEHIYVCPECRKVRIVRCEYTGDSLTECERVFDAGFML